MDTIELQRWLGVLFVAGCLLLGYPLLTVYSVPATIGGIPVLYAVIFAIWALLIGTSAWLLHRPSASRTSTEPAESDAPRR
ncbi:MAG: hypothetical protein PPP56_00770 [Longimonas sp.]|uniref:hypothetical protein n=1 Tax=Longimonas sp. TaxID=2039626 RepID=UPI003344ABA0